MQRGAAENPGSELRAETTRGEDYRGPKIGRTGGTLLRKGVARSTNPDPRRDTTIEPWPASPRTFARSIAASMADCSSTWVRRQARGGHPPFAVVITVDLKRFLGHMPHLRARPSARSIPGARAVLLHQRTKPRRPTTATAQSNAGHAAGTGVVARRGRSGVGSIIGSCASSLAMSANSPVGRGTAHRVFKAEGVLEFHRLSDDRRTLAQ